MTTEYILKRLIANVRYYEKYLRGARLPGTLDEYCDALLVTCDEAEAAQAVVEQEETSDGS